MKKYFHLFLVAIISSMTFVLTSCDDDEPKGDIPTSKGELTIDGKIYSFNIMASNITDDTYGCSVWNVNTSGTDVEVLLGFAIYNWSTVATGSYLTDQNFCLTWCNKDGAILGYPTSPTAIKVVSKDSKSITISFNNATLEDMHGYDSFTADGTITLPID